MSVSGARRSASVISGGAEASVNMPRPMGSAIERLGLGLGLGC